MSEGRLHSLNSDLWAVTVNGNVSLFEAVEVGSKLEVEHSVVVTFDGIIVLECVKHL